jgi:hypothetical protein
VPPGPIPPGPITPPPLVPVPPPFTYFEGDTVSVIVNVGSTQLQGAFAVNIDWDDGNVTTHPLTLGQANRIDHVYLDDKPGLQTDVYVTKLTYVYNTGNFSGQITQSTAVFPIANVAPARARNTRLKTPAPGRCTAHSRRSLPG